MGQCREVAVPSWRSNSDLRLKLQSVVSYSSQTGRVRVGSNGPQTKNMVSQMDEQDTKKKTVKSCQDRVRWFFKFFLPLNMACQLH